MKLDPFYLIVDDAGWLERLLPLGAKLVQLRIKDRPKTKCAHKFAWRESSPRNSARDW